MVSVLLQEGAETQELFMFYLKSTVPILVDELAAVIAIPESELMCSRLFSSENYILFLGSM